MAKRITPRKGPGGPHARNRHGPTGKFPEIDRRRAQSGHIYPAFTKITVLG
jgi:hypothetical protein